MERMIQHEREKNAATITDTWDIAILDLISDDVTAHQRIRYGTLPDHTRRFFSYLPPKTLSTMSNTLLDLPYGYDALKPFISHNIMELHQEAQPDLCQCPQYH